MRRGLSLIELLLSILIVAIATGAVTRAYLSGVAFEEKFAKSLDLKRAQSRFEDRMQQLLVGAKVGGDHSYFISPAPASGKQSPGVSSLVFTTWSQPPSSQLAQVQQADFETLNSRFGPQGGSTEVSISTEPIGDAGQIEGIFLRQQRPPDGDPSQGGEETLLDERVREIRFEFYDGTDWLTTWDSREAQKDKLPSAVRVTYVPLNESRPRTFIVRLPLGGGGAS